MLVHFILVFLFVDNVIEISTSLLDTIIEYFIYAQIEQNNVLKFTENKKRTTISHENNISDACVQERMKIV